MKNPSPVFTDVTGVILVGGKSSRLGRDKALLRIGGEPLIPHLKDLLHPLVREVFISGHHRPEFDALGIKTLPDMLPDSGPMGGLYTALASTDNPYVFILAGDMPMVPASLVRRIIQSRLGADAVIPRGPRGLEPLCAVYSQSCTNQLRNCLKQGNRRIVNALDGLRVLTPEISAIKNEHDPFFNINYPEDLEKLKA